MNIRRKEALEFEGLRKKSLLSNSKKYSELEDTEIEMQEVVNKHEPSGLSQTNVGKSKKRQQAKNN